MQLIKVMIEPNRRGEKTVGCKLCSLITRHCSRIIEPLVTALEKSLRKVGYVKRPLLADFKKFHFII